MNKQWMWVVTPLGIGVLLIVLLFVADSSPNSARSVTRDGVQIIDKTIGEGPAADVGDVVTVHYTGTLKSGKKFDSSLDHGEPFKFRIGEGKVIKGWDIGVKGMKVGGERTLIIPSDKGYGPNGTKGIPPNAELHFDIKLLKID